MHHAKAAGCPPLEPLRTRAVRHAGPAVRRIAGPFLVWCAVLAVTAGAADAVGPGTPGKVATIAAGGPVRIWDPVQAATQTGPEAGWTTIAPKGYPALGERTVSSVTRPQWSPDGTRLVFTRSELDPGDPPENGRPRWHQTSIWMYTVATGTSTRLTSPDPNLVDRDRDDERELGHTVGDFAPTFSPDGTTVAFVRLTHAGQDDPLRRDEGMQVWTVDVDGGAAVKRTDLGEDSVLLMLQWIPGTQELLAARSTDAGLHIARVGLGGGASPLAGTEDVTPPAGLDVSPDGERFSYVSVSESGFRVHVRPLTGGPDLASYPVHDFATFSPTGNGVLTGGCVDGQCGLVEKYAFATETARDVRHGETERVALGYPGSPGVLFDVQPQQLPVVFLPGFLGSVIACGNDNLWPGGLLPRPVPLKMTLAADGLTNAGCPGTKATGEPVRRVLGLNIYAGVSTYMSEHFGDRGAVLGWDWRKRPQESLLALDEKIDELLARDGLGKRQGVGRVVLWGHSYGGLLIRTYLAQMHPEKVARVLTLGSPYWGSPKAIFPVAFGVETPLEGPGLDVLFVNSRLKQLARNLGGLYQLFPGPRFGSWLTVDGRKADPARVLDDLGGNPALYQQAQGYHRLLFDGFFNDGGRIDVRAVAGSGNATIGGVDLRPRPKGTDGVGVTWVDGDGTVPGLSAVQGPVGTARPFGDPVHLQYTCGVEHVALANEETILDGYAEWLDHGALPGALHRAPCPFKATEFEFTPGTLGRDGSGARGSRRAQTAAARLGLSAAEATGRVQVVEGGRTVRVLVDRRRSGSLRLRLRRATFTATDVSPRGRGTRRVFGPVSGIVQIRASKAEGRPPVVTVQGRRVAPRRGRPPRASGLG